MLKTVLSLRPIKSIHVQKRLLMVVYPTLRNIYNMWVGNKASSKLIFLFDLLCKSDAGSTRLLHYKSLTLSRWHLHFDLPSRTTYWNVIVSLRINKTRCLLSLNSSLGNPTLLRCNWPRNPLFLETVDSLPPSRYLNFPDSSRIISLARERHPSVSWW